MHKRSALAPLYRFLKRKYGTWIAVSEVTGVPLSTIEKHNRWPHAGMVQDRNYEKVARIVALYRK